MSERICKKCGVAKPMEAYYPYQAQPCKDCWKATVRANRAAKIGQYRAYDRARANEPARIAAREEYARSELGRVKADEGKRRYIERNVGKRAAHFAVSNALRAGKLKKSPCAVCSSPEVEGHHFDYSRPLDVIWLCTHHHSAFHKIEREIQRAQKQEVA